jgi:hypothetical protein
MVTRATALHRDRPDEDPAGAPSGLRWVGWRPTGRELRRWELTGGRRRLGWCLRHWASRTWRAVVLADCGTRETVHEGALSDCARRLVREVRRG